jgi:hypothetical protein
MTEGAGRDARKPSGPSGEIEATEGEDEGERSELNNP